MNRRSFFQSIMAGIGALVGRKYLPKDKTPQGGYLLPNNMPNDLKSAILELPDVKSGELQVDFYCEPEPPIIENDAWCTTSYWDGEEFIQWRHLPYRNDEIIIDWVRSISKSTDAKTNKTTD